MNNEIQFSFYNCTPEQSPAISVHETEQTAYTYSARIAEQIASWITVSAVEFCRECIRNIIRIFCDFFDRTEFNRTFFIRQGAFRL